MERKTKQHRRGILIPPDIWRKLEEDAEENYISRSELIRKILREYVERQEIKGYDPKADRMVR